MCWTLQNLKGIENKQSILHRSSIVSAALVRRDWRTQTTLWKKMWAPKNKTERAPTELLQRAVTSLLLNEARCQIGCRKISQRCLSTGSFKVPLVIRAVAPVQLS
jgi:hypothetical protein